MTLNGLIPFRKQRRDRQEVPVRRSDLGFSDWPQEMNRLFDQLMPSFFRSPQALWDMDLIDGAFQPQVDIKETKKEIRVTVELPGVDERDVDVRLDGDTLTIRGEKREDFQETKEGWSHSECRYGSFLRAVPLGSEIDLDGVTARFKNGVLKVTLPKARSKAQDLHRIPVTTG